MFPRQIHVSSLLRADAMTDYRFSEIALSSTTGSSRLTPPQATDSTPCYTGIRSATRSSGLQAGECLSKRSLHAT